MSARRTSFLLAFVLLTVGVPSPAWAQWNPQDGVLLKGRIVTMDDQATVVDGAVLVQNGQITAILPAGSLPPSGNPIVIDTHGVIYPGLMNLHNHMAYNFLPPYPVPKDYGDRDQWPKGALYSQLVNNPKNIVTESMLFNRQTEALKLAEVKEIVGGTTAVQGSPDDPGISTILVRNVELRAFGQNDVADRVLAIDQHFIDNLAANQQRVAGYSAWFFHLAEGKDDHARLEYSNPGYDSSSNVSSSNRPGLKELGLVTSSLVGIHCAGLTETEFADWEQTTGGAKVIWSPLSNLMLYGQTTDVVSAIRHSATIALGTDWTPSGSKNLLWELKVADQYNTQSLGGALTTQQLVTMVTRNPARILGWDDKVGSIRPGLMADLVVVDDLGSSDPYRNLVDSVESNVQLVLVGGEPLYGDASLMQALKGVTQLEALNDLPNRPKALDLVRTNVPKGDQGLADVTARLNEAVSMDPGALAKVLNDGDPNQADPHTAREKMAAWLVQEYTNDGTPIPPELQAADTSDITQADVADYLARKYPNAQPLAGIDPIYEEVDPAFFGAVKQNLHFTGGSPVFDPSPLDRYRNGKAPGTLPTATGSGSTGSTGTGSTGSTGTGSTGSTGTGSTGSTGSTGTGAAGTGSTGTGSPGASSGGTGASSAAAGSTSAASTAAPGVTAGSPASSGGGGSGGCELRVGSKGGAQDLAPLALLALGLLFTRRAADASRG